MRWPFDRRVDAAHAWGVIAVGTAVLVGLPAVLATLHAADARFRWWWPTNWMAIPSIIFAAGCLLVAIPVRRTPDPRAAGAASPPRPAVPSPGDDRAGAAVRPGQVVAGEIPREPASFVTRETVNRLAAAGEGRVAVVYAVTGLRGVGKTQIAAAYARARVSEGWALVGWVNAETRDVLLNGLKRVADALGVADPEGDSEESARRLRAHLQTRAGEGLLVFDNATDPDGLREFLPATGGTQIVITTTDRAFAFAGLGLPVDVSAFTRPQSVGYLRARTGLADRDGADTVAHQLGDLPLGLAQAAATIARQHLTYAAVPASGCGRCRSGNCWAAARARTTRMRPPPRCCYRSRRPRQATPRGWPAGCCGSWRHCPPTGSPAPFCTASRRPGHDGGSQCSGAAEGASVIGRWTRRSTCCVAGSLLDWSVTGDAVLMHRLLARVLRERDQAGGQWASTVTAALKLLEPLLFPVEQAWSRREEGARLATQVEALWDADAEAGTSDPDLALGSCRPGPGRSGNYVHQPTSAAPSPPAPGPWPTASGCWAPTTPTRSAHGTTSHTAYKSAGRLEQAIGLHEQTLADRQRVLGADHPDTLTSRNNLAGAYQEAGRLEQAIRLYEQTLADSERVLGADHPDTLTSRNNLASAYQSAGRLEQAIRCTSRPWPIASGCWAPTTPTRSPHGTTSRTPTRRRAGWSRRSRCTSRPWPTGSGCWAPTTPTRSPHGTTSRTPTRRRPAGAGDRAARADPGRPAAGAGRRPPRHAHLTEQPRIRLSVGGPAGTGDRAVRADPGRRRAGAGRRPPRHAQLTEQPRIRL